MATSGLIEQLRLVKDPGEVARIRSACAIADRALTHIRPQLGDQPTEAEFAALLDATMRDMGAADVSFETIVASGPNGAKPHHTPSDRTIVDGDLVVIDFGALVDGYHSDMTRTIAVGDVGAERTRMLDVVLAAQDAGVKAIVAGVDAAEVVETWTFIGDAVRDGVPVDGFELRAAMGFSSISQPRQAQPIANVSIGSIGRPVKARTESAAAVMYSTRECWKIWVMVSCGRSLSTELRVTIKPAANATRNAGIWAIKPSPMVRVVKTLADSENDIPCSNTPRSRPTPMLMTVISSPAIASQRTNLLATTMAP